MTDLIRRIPWPARETADHLAPREWLVTNGLGGYASGTVSTVMTRRYHGLLIAALPAPFGRVLMLSHLDERLSLPDGRVAVTAASWKASDPGPEKPETLADLAEFRLEMGLPVWRYEFGDLALEKRLLLLYRQNTVHVSYRLLAGTGPVTLQSRPAVHFRPHEQPVNTPLAIPYALTVVDDRYEVRAGQDLPHLRLRMHGLDTSFHVACETIQHVIYPVERSRGYEATGDLWSPGYFQTSLETGASATLVASTEPWEAIDALDPESAMRAEMGRRRRLQATAHLPAARTGPTAELLLAADQFVIAPAGRVADTALTRATGDEARTIIAGYHWFTDWGRDTMISLEGLTLLTGRHVEAGYILRTFALYVRDGLIPNMFPEGTRAGLYHTADATLWYFHAIDRYVRATRDHETLRVLLPMLLGIVDHHVRGTRFGIGVDPSDGLLRQGAAGYQLTWMDAKVGDWVVTPRRGKAVEINALWYNALRLLEGWVREGRGDDAAALAARAEQVRASFNARFWYGAGGYLYDVVDGEQGDDAACRPNQVFAISLTHPVLAPERWAPVLSVVRERLVTPLGLRSLDPGHPDYKPTYHGDIRARDAAYHQGTVWPWLIGAFVEAWVRTHPEDHSGARRFVEAFVGHLDEACVGSISEIFDAEPPYTPRGCIAQGWSVAEVLRALILTGESGAPDTTSA